MANTANLVSAKPVSENDATKVTTYNTLLDEMDSAFAGYLTISVAGSANVTLTRAQSLNNYFEFTGALTGNIDVKLQATAGAARSFVVFNNTSGAFTLTVKTTAGASTGVAVTQAKRQLLVRDASHVWGVATSL